MKRILILSSERSFDRDKIDFSNHIDDRGQEFEVIVVKVQELSFLITENINRTKICLAGGRDIADFDLVFIKRAAGSNYWYAQTCAIYLKSRGVKIINSQLIGITNAASNKVLDHMLFSDLAFPIPDTHVINRFNIDNVFKIYANDLEFPMVLKSTVASRGEDNFLVEDFDAVRKTINNQSNFQKEFLLQPFIKNDCDYRVLVFGFKVRLVIRRTRVSDDTHMNNTSQGGNAEIVPLNQLNPGIIELAEKLASNLKREITGIDIMVSIENGSLVLLESNTPPEIETGTFVSEKCNALADYLDEIVSIGE